jgi:hypothetical protein
MTSDADMRIQQSIVRTEHVAVRLLRLFLFYSTAMIATLRLAEMLIPDDQFQTNPLALGLFQGVFMTLLMGFSHRGHSRWKSASRAPLVHQSERVVVAGSMAGAVHTVQEALKEFRLRDMQLIEGDHPIVKARTRWGWGLQGGDRIQVRFEQLGNDATGVTIESRPRLRTVFVDDGRNWLNVERIRDALLGHNRLLG